MGSAESVALAILLRLRALLQEPGGGSGYAPSPINSDHAPGKISPADVRAMPSSAHGRGTQHTTLVARPSPVVAGEARQGGWLAGGQGREQFPLEGDARHQVTRVAKEKLDGGEMGCVLGLEVPAPTD